MEIKTLQFFGEYEKVIGFQIPGLIKNFIFEEGFLALRQSNKSAAVYSLNITGSKAELTEFLKYEVNKNGVEPTKDITATEDLYYAYEYACANDLNEKNFINCHKLLAKHLLPEDKLGLFRVDDKTITTPEGRHYVTPEAKIIPQTVKVFFKDIEDLLRQELAPSKVFYHASLIHLKLLHIHPFADGNYTLARLLEKWFVGQKLGKKFWQIPSEKYYFKNKKDYFYYSFPGESYDEASYENCVLFSSMLAKSLSQNL